MKMSGMKGISRFLVFLFLSTALFTAGVCPQTVPAGQQNAIDPAGIRSGDAVQPSAQIHFVPNSLRFWNDPRHATTRLPEECHGQECTPIPAYADILIHPTNFVQCIDF